jgi:hypothetical protein
MDPFMRIRLVLALLGATAAPAAELTVALERIKDGAVFYQPTNLPFRHELSAAFEPYSPETTVDFYDGTNLIGETWRGDRWTFVWSNASFGTHALTAVADYQGTMATSSVVNVTVAPGGFAVVTNSAAWHYHDAGVDLGTTWRGTNYDDAAWPVGIGEFGFGDDHQVTWLRPVDESSNPVGTFYFRHQLVLDGPAEFTNAVAWIVVDDGAVVHLNGEEWFRFNMPTGEITYVSRALQALGSPEQDAINKVWLDASRLRPGTNTVAVQLHNATLFNQDVSFDFALVVDSPFTPPRWRLQRWGGNLLIAWPRDFGGFVLQATTNLVNPMWDTIPDVSSTVLTGEFQTYQPIDTQRFYRLTRP